MDEVNDAVHRKAVTLAHRLYNIWHCTGHETPWAEMSMWEQELWTRCAEQTVLAIAPDVWQEGNHDSKIILTVDPPRKKSNPYL